MIDWYRRRSYLKEGRKEGRLRGLVGTEKSRVNGFQTGRAREGAHEPIVDAVCVVGVHARQITNAVSHAEVYHADHTSTNKVLRDAVK